MGRSLFYPFAIGEVGVPRTAGRVLAIRHQIEQILFTMPGERVRRPDFGCGVQRLVFAGAAPESAAAAEYVIRLSLRKHLGDLITLDAVRVTASNNQLTIDILYTVISTGEERADTFERPLAGAS